MTSGDFRLIAGLGNPGTKYLGTRHNIGFWALEKIALREATIFRKSSKVFGSLAEIGVGAKSQKLLMPTTFMNESGKSIRAAADYFGLQNEQILVIADDMDLPLGRLRIRYKGGAGGHNGLKSTIQHLGSQDFSRIRIGIGPPSLLQEDRKEKTVSHVLGKFNAKETKSINKTLDELIHGLNLIKENGFERGSTYINSYEPQYF